MRILLRLTAVLVAMMASPALLAGKLSLHELQHYVDDVYPRTSTGHMQVTFHSPKVTFSDKENSVKIAFSTYIRSSNGSVTYHDVLTSIEGQLFLSKDKVYFSEVHSIRILDDSVPYTYRVPIERAITNMMIRDHIANPVIRVSESDSRNRLFPSFFVKPLTLVD